jgi:hypothetical protein
MLPVFVYFGRRVVIVFFSFGNFVETHINITQPATNNPDINKVADKTLTAIVVCSTG